MSRRSGVDGPTGSSRYYIQYELELAEKLQRHNTLLYLHLGLSCQCIVPHVDRTDQLRTLAASHNQPVKCFAITTPVHERLERPFLLVQQQRPGLSCSTTRPVSRTRTLPAFMIVCRRRATMICDMSLNSVAMASWIAESVLESTDAVALSVGRICRQHAVRVSLYPSLANLRCSPKTFPVFH